MSSHDDLLAAALAGDAERVAQLLTAEPALVGAAGPYHKTALHLAAEKDRAEVARVLLAHGARLDVETTWEMTPLEWAANLNSQGVANLLLAAGARLDLWSAAGLGRLDRVRGFWDEAGNLRPEASRHEYRQQLDGSWSEDPDERDDKRLVSDAFYIACRNGHTEVARFLLDQGADLHVRGFWGGTALHWAAGGGHLDTVRFLLRAGARTDLLDEKHRDTPRGWAEHMGKAEVAAALGG